MKKNRMYTIYSGGHSSGHSAGLLTGLFLGLGLMPALIDIASADWPAGAMSNHAKSGRVYYGDQTPENSRQIDFNPDGSTSISREGNKIQIDRNGSIKIETGNPDYDRGIELLAAEKYAEALSYFDRAIEKDPTLVYAYLNRALTYTNLNKPDPALDDVQRVLQLSAAGWTMKNGHSYLDPADRKELDILSGSALVTKANIEIDREEYEAGIADMTKAIALGLDKDADNFEARGSAYYNLQKYPEAVADISKAIDLGSKNNELLIYRGRSYQKLNRRAEADKDYQTAFQRDPELKKRFGDWASE